MKNLRTTLMIIVFASMIMLTTSCTVKEHEKLGRLSGSVTGSATGELIPNATVSIYDVNLQTTSDAGGRFTFIEVPEGKFTVTAIAANFLSRQIPDVEIWDDATTRIDFLLPRLGAVGTLEGIVKNATNAEPVVGATISVVGEDSRSVISDDSGRFKLTGIPEGPNSIKAKMDGFFPLTANDVFIVEDSTTKTDFILSPGLTGTGILRVVLTWGEFPPDLDSHVKTPEIDGDVHHVYYASRGDSAAAPFMWLDVDDVTSYGPETITFNQTFSGYYYYFVKNYTEFVADSAENVTGLSASEAVVQIYDEDGARERFEVPTQGTGLFWNVCVIDLRNLNVIPVNRIELIEPGPEIVEEFASDDILKSYQRREQ